MWRSDSAFEARMRCGGVDAKKRSCPSAAEWNVLARRPSTPRAPSRARISPAALSVNVTARISPAAKAPDATWLAIRRVIVVVFPDPAPARMQTGPRTALTARRCSAFNPAKITSDTAPTYCGRQTLLVNGLLRNRVFLRDAHVHAVRQAHHHREARDDVERLTRRHQPFELPELVLQPHAVD